MKASSSSSRNMRNKPSLLRKLEDEVTELEKSIVKVNADYEKDDKKLKDMIEEGYAEK